MDARFLKYKEIKTEVKHEEADFASLAFIECGSEGVSVDDVLDNIEALNSSHFLDYYDRRIISGKKGTAVVCGGFAPDYDSSELKKALTGYLGYCPELTETEKEACDWENSWRNDYEITEYPDFYVVPVWMNGKNDKPGIYIDPGHGFGTGRHETTSMCLKLICEVDCREKTVIDIGCGSGILGIASLKKGAADCIFTDIDPDAVASAKETLKLNGIMANVFCGDVAETFVEAKDVVLANLSGEILTRLSKRILGLSKKGGFLILSGITEEKITEVKEAYAKDADIIKELKEGGWNAVLLRKK